MEGEEKKICKVCPFNHGVCSRGGCLEKRMCEASGETDHVKIDDMPPSETKEFRVEFKSDLRNP